ncbi:MAG: HEAT repeat domain-containing protein, partial [Candidatus Zixiibacteriota bacterium]
LQPRQKRIILQPLAFNLHKSGLREEKRDKVIKLLENELPKIGIQKEKVSALLEDIRDRCGILVEAKLGFFGFSHLTFQEFLTARYILDNNLEEFLVNKKRDKYWLEVALLYCGMRDTTNLLQNILEQKEDIFYTNLFFAGKCLAESLSVSAELRAYITKQIFDILWDRDEFTLTKQTDLEVLKEIKDKKIIAKLIDKTKDKDSYVRGSAADALGQIQTKESVAPLIELLKDKYSYVRRHAAYALGQIKAQESVAPLMELLKDKDSYVRGSAADALGQIGYKNSIDGLKLLLDDKESSNITGEAVRETAFKALKMISEKNGIPIYPD